MPPVATQTDAAALRAALHETMGRAVVGQLQVIDGLYIAVLCGGHVLLEGVPGHREDAHGVEPWPRRWTPASRGSSSLLTCSRPTSSGRSVYRPGSGTFEFREGPIFTDTLLADEINRAPAKTQSALLEAMEERQVTSDGESRVAWRPLSGRGDPEPRGI